MEKFLQMEKNSNTIIFLNFLDPLKKKKKPHTGLRSSSVMAYLPSRPKALGSITSFRGLG
jgi:hypothetical protein